jgi:hypothetical protein
MRAVRIATVSATVGAAILGMAGAASADSAGANPIVVVPSNPAPGAQISVFDGGNCPNGAGTATFTGPSVIDSVPLSTLSNQVGGVTPIPQDARPGMYTVTIACKGGGTFFGTMTISGGNRNFQGFSPSGGAATGDGASLGSGGTTLGAGSAAAAGAAFLGVAAYRRRRAAAQG